MLEFLVRYRFVAVVAMLGTAAALATPRGRLPMALRGLRKTLGAKDSAGSAKPVPFARRLAAFLLVALALAVAAVPVAR